MPPCVLSSIVGNIFMLFDHLGKGVCMTSHKTMKKVFGGIIIAGMILVYFVTGTVIGTKWEAYLQRTSQYYLSLYGRMLYGLIAAILIRFSYFFIMERKRRSHWKCNITAVIIFILLIAFFFLFLYSISFRKISYHLTYSILVWTALLFSIERRKENP